MKKWFIADLKIKTLVGFLILGGVLVLSWWAWSSQRNIEQVVSDQTLKIDLTGYYLKTCVWNPTIYVFEKGLWRKTNRYLPRKGTYYLDGELRGYEWCDVVMCERVQGPIRIDLVEYKKIDEKKEEYLDKKIPEYQSIKLKGLIKIEFEYFSDSKCKNKKVYSKELKIK